MAVGLGRTIGSPVFLLFQIIHGVSLFFVMLGVSRVLLGMAELTSTTLDGGTARTTSTRADVLNAKTLPDAVGVGNLPVSAAQGQPSLLSHRAPLIQAETLADMAVNTVVQGLSVAAPPFSVQLSYCFHVPLLSLFHSPVPIYSKHANSHGGQQRRGINTLAAALPTTTSTSTSTSSTRPPLRLDGTPTRFYLQHLLTGVLCAYPLATLLQRRKFVLDFVATIYVVYWVLTDLMLQAVLGGGTLHWWGACLVGFVTMYGATYAICGRKEMQEVKLSGAAVGHAAVTATVTTANATAGTSASPVPAGGATWLKDSRGEEAREMEEARPAFPDGFGLGGASSGGGAAAAMVAASSGGGVIGGGSRGRSGPGTASPKPVVVDMSRLDDGQVKSKSV